MTNQRKLETKERIDLRLEKRSLLVMNDEIQSHWLHRLPPTKKVKSPRWILLSGRCGRHGFLRMPTYIRLSFFSLVK